MRKKGTKAGYSLSVIMTVLVVGIVLAAFAAGFLVFVAVYSRSMRNNTITASEQAVVQVSNTVSDYTKNMRELIGLIQGYYRDSPASRNTAIDTLITTRNDIVLVTCYDEDGTLLENWSGRRRIKEQVFKNLSLNSDAVYEDGKMTISKPHVETLLADYYPWVVSIQQPMTAADGSRNLVVMDIRFSQIADYVDEVGIGQHGYCFIMDREGDMVYHPQQQLIFSGLKEERLELLKDSPDGYLEYSDVIYTIKTMADSGWRVVGVSYVDELITRRVQNVAALLLGLLLLVLFTTICSSLIFSGMISKPVKNLMKAMEEFEGNASDFTYYPVEGSREIGALSQSFGHMVVRIQQLMEKVREEEITLRKAELRALQAQINPHFLYNTLDSIGWMCEEERTQEAVEMVNALAKLFRISISKGHEIIMVEKELEHARSYLKIEKFRYKEQFSYSFDVEEECLKYYCNKITLQPIIENAIYHGLDRMVDEGEIRISVKSRENNLIFIVEDNGIGMTEEQCREILEGTSGDKTGIGIRNVNNRIKIYFGEEYGIRIQSEPDEGTRVIITMPKIREGGYEER